MKTWLTLLKYDLKQRTSNYLEMCLPLCLWLIITIILNFIDFKNNFFLFNFSLFSPFWLSYVMVLLLVSDQISSNADHQAIYEQLKIATGSHKQIILIKAIGYWLTNALPISMLTIGLMVGAGVPQIKLCYLSLTLLIISINYSILQVSLSALTIGLRMRELIIPVLLMPLLTPSILGGTAIIVELMQPNIDLSMINSSLTMMAGIGLIWIVSSLLILEI